MGNANRNVKSIKTTKENNNLSIVIPIAGAGSKTKSFGPKSLLNIRGTALIERQLNIIYDVYPTAEVILVVGFEYQKIIKR